jgi:hypothetical protein
MELSGLPFGVGRLLFGYNGLDLVLLDSLQIFPRFVPSTYPIAALPSQLCFYDYLYHKLFDASGFDTVCRPLRYRSFINSFSII